MNPTVAPCLALWSPSSATPALAWDTSRPTARLFVSPEQALADDAATAASLVTTLAPALTLLTCLWAVVALPDVVDSALAVADSVVLVLQPATRAVAPTTLPVTARLKP